MEWAVAALALVLLVGLGLARALRERRQRPDPAQTKDRPTPTRGNPARRNPTRGHPARGDPEVSPEDEAELVREFAAVEAESSHALEALLELRLRVLCSRRVPLRAIRAAPGPHTGRLAFADGTILLARARRSGELYRLAISIADHPVCLASWSREDDGTVLHFTWPQESAELIALGLDQAD